jgi:hypothetical protein
MSHHLGALMRSLAGGIAPAKRENSCDLQSNLGIPSEPTERVSGESTTSYTTRAERA